MAVNVTIPSSSGLTKVTIPTTSKVVSTSATQSLVVTSAKLEQLANIATPDGLQDGFTLVYDTDTGNFIAQAISVGSVSGLDGGTY